MSESSGTSRVKTALLAGGLLAPVLGVLLVIALPIGGYYAYRTYDYVQHDNDFCLSCHLMEGPYEAFARSEHRGLGCKACHRPTLVGRSQMALTQVVDQPDELGTHAEVPDAVCVECHVDGDPLRWRNIAASAGHRIHEESPDSTLVGLRCVTCHSTSIHEFSSVDDTCGQSECHVETEVQLGAMGDFTIHCVACHAFREPTAGTDLELARTALRPAEDECLSCHVMRSLTDIPEDEPHEGVCATCHNPHTQSEAAEANATCATAACHTEPAGLSPLHVGIPRDVLDDCVQCHTAHDFRADGADCMGCHTDIGARPLPAVGSSTTPTAGNAMFAGRTSSRPGARPGVRPGARPSARHVPVLQQVADTLLFTHDRHMEIDCAFCHDASESHGAVTVTAVEDCRSCHHTAQANVADCVTCHATTAPFRTAQLEGRMAFALSAGEPREGSTAFDHAAHAEQTCGTCHAGEPELGVTPAACVGCHIEHHTPTVDCASCHLEAPAGAHPAEVHLGCGGAGCHTETPVEGVPRTRPFCLTCHQDLRDHRIEENCITCHPLPQPSAAS